MPKIAILIDDLGPQRAVAIATLRTVIDLPLREISVSVGSNKPLIERALYDRKYPEFAAHMLRLLRELDTLSVRYRAFELLDEQSFDARDCHGYFQVYPDRLKRMIETRSESLESIRKSETEI